MASLVDKQASAGFLGIACTRFTTRKAHKMDSSCQSPSICQRLISFVVGRLRRPPALPRSAQVPVEEGSSRKPRNRPNGFVDSEIAVEFRHTDGSKGRGDSILAQKKDGLIVSNDQTVLQNGLDRKEGNKDRFASSIDPKTGRRGQGEGIRGLEAVSRGDAARKGLKESVGIKESEEKKKKEANQSADQATMANNRPHEDTKPRPQRPHWPLLSVASNINEKADAYIDKRRRVVGRNYSLEPEKS